MANEFVFENNTASIENVQFAALRGFADFGNLKQFNLFEGGNGLISVINAPAFMAKNPATKQLTELYINILENEFKGLDGLGNIESEASQISDGITELEMITKVTEPGSTTITMNFTEKAGRPLTKFNEAMLRGIRDPKSQVRHYNGWLKQPGSPSKPGYQYEVFNLLYIVMNNSWTEVEGAYILLNAQPTNAELSILNVTRGQNDFKELGMEFRCLPIRGNAVNKLAYDYLTNIVNVIELNSNNFNWSISGVNTAKVDNIANLKAPSYMTDGVYDKSLLNAVSGDNARIHV